MIDDKQDTSVLKSSVIINNTTLNLTDITKIKIQEREKNAEALGKMTSAFIIEQK